jgi:hypothetical protein
MSRITIYRDDDSKTLKAITDCHESNIEYLWRISDDAKKWVKLNHVTDVIPYHGDKFYFVEAICGKERLMGGSNFSLIQPIEYSRRATASKNDTNVSNRTTTKKKKKIMPVRVEWDFKRLPKSEHKRAIDAFNSTDYYLLREIHNTYQLSENEYCCSWKDAVLNWWKKGIENGEVSL